MAQNHLHEIQRKTTEEETDKVRNEEGPASILITDVREPPNIAKTNCTAKGGEEILVMTAPFSS